MYLFFVGSTFLSRPYLPIYLPIKLSLSLSPSVSLNFHRLAAFPLTRFVRISRPRTMLKPAHSKALSCLTILCAGLFAWMTACLITGTAYPVMVVSSESMEPTFYRGDLILLWNRRHTLRAGDIPVVWFDGYPRPMVHRAIKVFDEEINEGPLTRYALHLTPSSSWTYL